MGLINEILGYIRGAGESDTVEGVEAALRRLTAERSAANEAIGGGAGRRRALLLEDGSDKAIAALDRELDGHRLVLERLELVEGQLFDRLQTFRSARRQASWKILAKKYNQVAVAHIEAIRTAIGTRAAVTAAIDEARANGFEAEAMATFIAAPYTLQAEIVDAFEAGIERAQDNAAARPAVTVARPTVVKPAKPQSLQRRVFSDERPAAAPRKKRDPIIEKPVEGQVAVTVLRAGYESPSGKQCLAGDIVAMPVEMAKTAVRNSAVAYIDGASA